MSPELPPAIVWFRDDLRVADNPALDAAVRRGAPVVCLYVLDEESDGIRPHGGAAKWWLHHALTDLDDSLRGLGAALTLRRGNAVDVIAELREETKAGAVFWNRRYGPAAHTVDEKVKSAIRDDGDEATSFAGSLMFEPWTIKTGSDTPFSVFTPFYNACLAAADPRGPIDAPEKIVGYAHRLASDDLDDWGLLPEHPDWAGPLRDTWEVSEKSAMTRLEEFLADDAADYEKTHDQPAADGVSGLSPYLRWGQVSPYQVWQKGIDKRHRTHAAAKGVTGFLRQIVWREFCYSTLYFHNDLATVNLHRQFDAFPWPRLHPSELEAWQKGCTGIPLVDAGMRELWATGIVHNRVRMVVASFLIKNLLIDWRRGEEWFWDTLVDADEASNPFNWQWVAGSGADAAPYFRVFNPLLQQDKFDPDDRYVKHWVPEFGSDEYPEPMVDLKETRKAALAAYDHVKNR